MDLSNIELKKSFEKFAYTKLASQIDECEDKEELKNIAKAFCKLYYKQQETIAVIGLPTE